MIFGVSLDTVESHKKFCAGEGLNFKLLADVSHKVAESYGSFNNFGLVKFATRNTFLIDPQGKIVRVFTGLDPQRHSPEVLAALHQLQ